MTSAIENLSHAIRFLDLCRADPTSTETGAKKDAWQWLEEAAREVVKDAHITEYYRDKQAPGQPSPMPR